MSWLLPVGATASAMSGALNDIRIRFATIDDAGLLLRLIRDLAAYERVPNAVAATEEDLRRYGFGPERQFEALLAFLDGKPAGFALVAAAPDYGTRAAARSPEVEAPHGANMYRQT